MGLVEILISMTILAIALASITPLIIGSLRASRTAQLNTQARALGQERIEKMRNLPFHVARQNGKYIDVLDLYFQNLKGLTAGAGGADPCSTRQYDSTSGINTCTITNLLAPYQQFTQVVMTRFLDANRNVVFPPSYYDSQTDSVDMPASNLLGVDVVTRWVSQGKTHTYTVHSQIANAAAGATLLQAKLRVSPLSITSNMASGDLGQLQAGLLSIEGGVASGSSSSLSATTALASLSSGLSVAGVQESLSAPADKVGNSPSDSNGHSLDVSACATLCFGQTAITGDQNVKITAGDPIVSSSSNPIVLALRRTGSNVYRGFSYSNADSSNGLDTSLRLQGPMVSGGSGSTSDVVVSKGWMSAAGTGATSTVNRGDFYMPVLQLFPTSFTPNGLGLVQVEVDSAYLSCQSGAGTSSVTSDWHGQIQWWDGTRGGYVERDLTPGGTQLPDPSTIIVDPNTGLTLSHWISSWSSLTSKTGISRGVGARAVGAVNSLVSIITAPTRTGDATSALNISVGAMSCVAEDVR